MQTEVGQLNYGSAKPPASKAGVVAYQGSSGVPFSGGRHRRLPEIASKGRQTGTRPSTHRATYPDFGVGIMVEFDLVGKILNRLRETLAMF